VAHVMRLHAAPIIIIITTITHLHAALVAVHDALHQQRVAFVVSAVGTHTRSERLSQLVVMPEPADNKTQVTNSIINTHSKAVQAPGCLEREQRRLRRQTRKISAARPRADVAASA